MLRRPRETGFTLVELITVMVLVGVLVAVAAPRFFERQSYDTRTFLDQSRFMLRHAQKLAVAQNRPVYVWLNGSSIALCLTYPGPGVPVCPVSDHVRVPGLENSASKTTLAACSSSRTWYCEGLPQGVSYATSPASTYFYFDAQGAPFAAADVSPTPTSTFSGLQIRITGDGRDYDIFVEPETGYVHL